MATGLKHPFVTLAEYFAREDSATERLEYLNGEIRSMGGAQPEHNAISANLIAELRSALRGSGCRPMTSDQRVKVNAGSPYLYPDVSVACDPEYAPINGLRTLVNPVLIIEVTSPSTEQRDRGTKFLQYQTIASLRHYVLVDSTEVGLLHYAIIDGHWQPTLYESTDDALQLPDLGLTLALREVYLDVWPSER
jgi:Uma2 family endonuclease